VQADAQRRHRRARATASSAQRRGDHQACRGENAAAMCRLAASSLRERRRNHPPDDHRFKQHPAAPQEVEDSTPSRKRRFIISGLAIISATMDAIFDGRK